MSKGVAITMFIFFAFMSIASVYMYRSIKRSEDAGKDVIPPSKAMIPGGIFIASGALFFLLYALGLIDNAS